jgi:hypothetical protein
VVLNDGTIAGKLRGRGRRQQETADVEARCQHRTYKFYTFQSGNPPQNRIHGHNFKSEDFQIKYKEEVELKEIKHKNVL